MAPVDNLTDSRGVGDHLHDVAADLLQLTLVHVLCQVGIKRLKHYFRAAGLNVVIEMKENWGQILGRFPGRGICENSNSSWFNDPVASLAATLTR